MPRRYLGTVFVLVVLFGLLAFGAFASLQYTSKLPGAAAYVRERKVNRLHGMQALRSFTHARVLTMIRETCASAQTIDCSFCC